MGQEFALASLVEKGANPFQKIVDIGTVTFSTTDSQATYRTSLKEVLFGTAGITGTTSLATDATEKDWVNIPLGTVTAGAITLTRSSKGTSGAKYAVMLIGTKYVAAP